MGGICCNYKKIILFILVFILYVSLAGSMPVSIMTWQWADDGLFLRLAQEISEGRWLGEYDHLTLVKGPIFPIFIAITSFTGLPYNFILPILHFLGVALFSWVICRISGRRYFALTLMLLLLLCPGLFLEMKGY